jgi:hypothetical protein
MLPRVSSDSGFDPARFHSKSVWWSTFWKRCDNFQEVGLPMARWGTSFCVKYVYSIFQMTPVAVLVAVMISLGLLARNSV